MFKLQIFDISNITCVVKNPKITKLTENVVLDILLGNKKNLYIM